MAKEVTVVGQTPDQQRPRMGPVDPGLVQQIQPAEIYVSVKENPRKKGDQDRFKELVSSIKSKGLLVPILVRPWDKARGSPPSDLKYDLVYGSRRLQAVKELGLETIPTMVRTMTDQEAAEARIIENLQREDIDIVDEARGFAVILQRFGWRQEDVAERIGKSSEYVRKRLAVLEAPEYILKELSAGTITLGHALILRGIQDEKERKERLAGVLHQGWSAKTLYEYASRARKITRQTPFDTTACLTCRWYGGRQKELLLDELGKQAPAANCGNKGCYTHKMDLAIKALGTKYQDQGLKVRVDLAGHGYLPDPGVELRAKPEFWQPSRKDAKKCRDCKSRIVVIEESHEGGLKVEEFCTNAKCENWKVRQSDRNEAAQRKKEKERQKKERARLDSLLERVEKKVDQRQLDQLLIRDLLCYPQKKDPVVKAFIRIHEIDISGLDKGEKWTWTNRFMDLVTGDQAGKAIRKGVSYPAMIRTLVLQRLRFGNPSYLEKLARPAKKGKAKK